MQAWKAESETVDPKAILRALRQFRRGNFSVRLPENQTGIAGEIARAFNETVEINQALLSEFQRVGKAIEKEGQLSARASLPRATGSWAQNINSFNSSINGLTGVIGEFGRVVNNVGKGDLTEPIGLEINGQPLRGEVLGIAKITNNMIALLDDFAGEVTRVAREVGTEGKLGGSADVPDAQGTWRDLTDNVNDMAGNLTNQIRDIAMVASAVADGDLDQKITVDVKGEILDLKNTINAMVDRLRQFSSEVTRIALEVGTEGVLGGQAEVEDVSGVWLDLTDNVNTMAGNLTNQVRNIAEVISAVASGDLSQKITVDVKGEILELKDTINGMTGTLNLFAGEVTKVAREVGTEGKLGGSAEVPDAQGTWRNLTDNVNELAGNLTRQVRAILNVVTTVTEGDLTGSIEVEASGEVELLRTSLNQMITTLKDTSETNFEQNWLKTNLSRFGEIMQGKKDLQSLAEVLITELCQVLDASHGVFYQFAQGTEENPEDPELRLLSSYAYKKRKNLTNVFALGEGLVGQCALEKKRIIIENVPDDYVKISSGLGDGAPKNLVVLAVLFEDNLMGVVELASFQQFTENQLAFLDQLMVSVGIVTNSVNARARTETLLEESQTLSEELQTQQEELKTSNEQLEEQAKILKESETKLKNQQEELQQTNEELEEKSQVLADQKTEVEQKNLEVEQAKQALEDKATQLALTSKYKSEFLANMSHELRTPLNSLLVLSEGMKKNSSKNLNKKQVMDVATIYEAGVELLDLINEILDLAKIESGKMPIEIGDIFFTQLKERAQAGFQQLATNKNLKFDVTLAKELPKSIRTDDKRLNQVLKNLLSNAFKFTHEGSVKLAVSVAKEGWEKGHQALDTAEQVIGFAVKDTGVGIAKDKQQVIFEAFQQADGTTSRKYGGTGLGLSISREIATILGGQIILESQPNKGSAFTLYIPQAYTGITLPVTDSELAPEPGAAVPEQPAVKAKTPAISRETVREATPEVPDDRANLTGSDRVVLIIEDDTKFATILLEKAREGGFKGVVATRGDDGFALAQKIEPDAILLDIRLPVMSGWTVLDRIKHDPKISHIPVHILSVEDARQRSLKSGALSFLKKPADQTRLAKIFKDITDFKTRGPRQLLIVEDNARQRKALVDLIGNGDVNVTAVDSGKKALAYLKKKHFDCLVLDLMMPDIDGFQLIGKIKRQKNLINLPIIIYTGKSLTKKEENKLNEVAETIIIKDVRSPERLLSETALFLHRVEAKLPKSKRQMLQQVHENDPALAGRKILIVDDDIRNIYAMNSIFEAHDSVTLFAESGREAIATLKKNPDVELILMDIMMPDMDGYQTMQAIRKMEKFKNLPIIAVTAKAMKEDREKCLDAGASDYIAKPVNTDQLLSLVRVWLYK
ncbi:MAG: response regulator [Proteobacteria bacterium]|nr:response regulator [Pseudomonadota bacterium]